MFIHAVLFEIKPKELPVYRKDSKMWAGYAKKARGFICCLVMRRINAKNHYLSLYQWKTRADHDRFTKKYHDWLAGKSRSKVRLLDRLNLKSMDEIFP